MQGGSNHTGRRGRLELFNGPSRLAVCWTTAPLAAAPQTSSSWVTKRRWRHCYGFMAIWRREGPQALAENPRGYICEETIWILAGSDFFATCGFFVCYHCEQELLLRLRLKSLENFLRSISVFFCCLVGIMSKKAPSISLHSDCQIECNIGVYHHPFWS